MKKIFFLLLLLTPAICYSQFYDYFVDIGFSKTGDTVLSIYRDSYHSRGDSSLFMMNVYVKESDSTKLITGWCEFDSNKPSVDGRPHYRQDSLRKYDIVDYGYLVQFDTSGRTQVKLDPYKLRRTSLWELSTAKGERLYYANFAMTANIQFLFDNHVLYDQPDQKVLFTACNYRKRSPRHDEFLNRAAVQTEIYNSYKGNYFVAIHYTTPGTSLNSPNIEKVAAFIVHW